MNGSKTSVDYAELLQRRQRIFFEQQQLLLAKLLVDRTKEKKVISSLAEVEFRVFSQWGDDGIIQWLIHNLKIPNQTFIEFGVENYRESNTRFLLMNDNWSGMIIDSSPTNIAEIQSSEYFWRYELQAKSAFITRENINALIAEGGFDYELGLLHIDVDGIDYWIWEAIDVVRPIILILEYNSVFGCDRTITVPYREDFDRTKAHYSNLYFGASLSAMCHLSQRKGYKFIGSNSAANNAYFIRADHINSNVREVTCSEGYIASKARESRNRSGELTYISGALRIEEIRGLPVVDILSGNIERL